MVYYLPKIMKNSLVHDISIEAPEGAFFLEN
jgi:hypothetical protein